MHVAFTLVNILISLVIIVDCQNVKIHNIDTKISRVKGNILNNITGTQAFQDHIVTSSLDNSPMIRMVYRSVREMYSRIIQGTGERHDSERFQKRIPQNVVFPCKLRGFRSAKIPKSVHQLRPGGKIIE